METQSLLEKLWRGSQIKQGSSLHELQKLSSILIAFPRSESGCLLAYSQYRKPPPLLLPKITHQACFLPGKAWEERSRALVASRKDAAPPMDLVALKYGQDYNCPREIGSKELM